MTSAVLSTFSDVVSFLAQSFKLAAVIPAFVFAFLNELIILPHLPQKGLIAQVVKLDVSDKAIIAAALSLLLGYTLTIINVPLVRVFEGYPWRRTFLGRLLLEYQQARLEALEIANTSGAVRLRKRIGQLRAEANTYKPGEPRREYIFHQLRVLEQRLQQEENLCADERRSYLPADPAELLPTALGNTIKSFEDYPWERYGADAVVLWPRLLPTLTKENYASYVEREKAGFDFPLNMSFLLGILSFEAAYVGLIYGEDYFPWLCGAALSMLFTFTFYKVSITGAFNWGVTVRVAFDLYRYKLLRALQGRPPDGFGDEVTRWNHMSLFLKGGEESDDSLTEEQLDELLDYPRIKRHCQGQQPTDNGDDGGDE